MIRSLVLRPTGQFPSVLRLIDSLASRLLSLRTQQHVSPDGYDLLIDSSIGNELEQANDRINDLWLRVDFQ